MIRIAKMKKLDPDSQVADTSLAIVIPAYNAETSIAGVLLNIPSYVDFIVVVDDCSQDATAEIVNSMRQKDDRIILISHAVNQGVGGATLSGYIKAREHGAEILVKMDSDGQMDPIHIPSLVLPIISGAVDYTKGNRFLTVHTLRSMPIIRRIGNIGLSFLTKLASGYWNIFDPTNGYTAIHGSLMDLIDRSRLDPRYFFESSLLIELGLIRAVVCDINIPANYPLVKSHLSELKSLFEFPPKLFAGFLRRLFFQYYVKDFSAFSILLSSGLVAVISGAIWGAYHWSLSIQTGVAASTGTVMIAVLPVILGVQFIIQALVIDIQNTPSHPLH